MIAKTTLNKLRACSPCETGWRKLLAHLGKTKADDEPLPLSVILESNGIDDALWSLRSSDCGHKARLFACDCAQAVAYLNPDPRVQAAIDVSRRFANGQATDDELEAARAAAWGAARVAAGDAAWGAARAAAWGAARVAARAAAGDAAREAAWGAAREAAGDAAREASRAAAGDAAREAAGEAQKQMFISRFCTEEVAP